VLETVGTERTVTKTRRKPMCTTWMIFGLDSPSNMAGWKMRQRKTGALQLKWPAGVSLTNCSGNRETLVGCGRPGPDGRLVLTISFLLRGSVTTGSKVRFSLPPRFLMWCKKSSMPVKKWNSEEMEEAWRFLVIFSCAGRFVALGPLNKWGNRGGCSKLWGCTYGRHCS